jgi:FkbM family methyltransferase
MILDLETPGISKTLFIYGTRELLDTYLVQNEISNDMNVLDVGGNIGYYALLEASLLKTGKVYVFEPDPRNFKILRKNIELNNLQQKIKAYPYALAEEEGVREFYLGRKTNLSSLIRQHKDIDSISVQSMRLDNFDEINNIDFIRMDIEGYECMVIDGMCEFLKKTKKPVKFLIEVHPALYDDSSYNFKKRLKFLYSSGFYIKHLISAGVDIPEMIAEYGYKPAKTVREGKFTRGLYRNIKTEDLLHFLDNKTKIVRAILLEKRV